MKKFTFRALFFILFVILIVSCRREEVSINQLYVQPYVRKDTSMGLSVYIMTNIEDEGSLKFQITDPTGDLVWQFEPERIINSGVTYLGSSRVQMPTGSLLSQGEWKFLLMYKDGRSIERKFNVFYKDLDEFLEKTSSTKTAFFSSSSNLTYLPK